MKVGQLLTFVSCLLSQGTLSRKFKVSGIPTLILLDAHTGQVNQSDGRSVVAEDPTGADFPWVAKSLKGERPGASESAGGVEGGEDQVFSVDWLLE